MKVAIIQICSSLDYKENLKKINDYIIQAKSNEDIDAVFLPEVFYSMSDGTKPTPYLIEDGNEHYKNIQKLAIDNNVYLLGGSAATLEDGKVFNRAYQFSPEGEDLGKYDKRKLFAINLKGEDKANLNEAKVYSAGNVGKTLKVNGFTFGLSICFDLRFPEIYREYFKQGVEVFTISSAFTVPTGKAHWETLLKARAIENQSYVIAANQWGEHNEKIKTYGHSMIIDPWGEKLIEISEGEGYITANLSKNRIEKVRERMNINPIT